MTQTSPQDVVEPSLEAQREALQRTLVPRSVAIVGISETSRFASSAQRTLLSEAEIFFVHPKAETIFGHPVHRDLTAIGRPVDAVFSVVSADRTLTVVEQAAEIGAGGVVTVAGGFAELGPEGVALQQRMRSIAKAGNVCLVGPNGVGMINVPKRLDLTMLAPFQRRIGGLSAVTHSGAMIEAIAASAWRTGGIGLNLLISAGNEAVNDIADYLDFLVDDPGTRVIALAMEKIRRPDEFFDAAERALRAGKPIIAIKMGRSARGQKMAASHTGTLTNDDAWTYEVALRQAGIQMAYDIDDLVDKVQFLERFPAERWSPVRGLAVLTATGGFAQLSSDLGEDLGVDIPDAPRLESYVREKVPGAPVPNPLDATGFAGGVPGLWDGILDTYVAAPEFDAYLFTSQHADWDEQGRGMADAFIARASSTEKPMIVAPLAGLPGQWLAEYENAGVAVGNGLRGCLLGVRAMGEFVRTRKDRAVRSSSSARPVERPATTPITVAEGRMLPFEATMELLTSAGVTVAPYELIPGGADVVAPAFAGPWVVKLADVAHRTEHDAVRVGVEADGLAAAVAELRGVALRDELPPLIAVQQMVQGIGEAFIGIQGRTDLGPLVVFGLGGVFVEVMKRIGGRFAPFTAVDAAELVEEFTDTGVLDGVRGRPGWPRQSIVDTLVAAGDLAAGGRGWIASIDINPLIVTANGLVAVDGLCLLHDTEQE
jgi:acetate---CoA ligase (ADP-forming)